MTTTLTLTPDPGTASVLVQGTTDAAGVTLVRADQNGAVPVRLLAGQELGGAFAVRDHEPALVGPVRYTATTTEPVALRRNRAVDPRGASTNGTGGGAGAWAPRWFGNGGNGTVTHPVSDGPDGAQTVMIRKTWETIGGAQDIAYSLTNSSEFVVTPGQRLIVDSWLRTSWSDLGSVDYVCDLNVYYFDANGQQVGEDRGQRAARGAANSWRRLDFDGIVPTGAVRAAITQIYYTDAQNLSFGATMDGTRLYLSDKPGEYFDGSTPGAEWLGPPNASQSVIRGPEVVEQLVRFDEPGPLEVATDVWSMVERPQYSARGRLTLGQQLEAADRSSRHEIIGRPDPVFTMQRGGYRTGTIEVLCLDIAAVEGFYALMQQAGIVLLRASALSPGQRLVGDLYVKVRRVQSETVEGTAPWRFRVRVTVEEVRRPTGPLLGSALWTYDALAGSGLTYETVPATFATYNDLAAGVVVDA